VIRAAPRRSCRVAPLRDSDEGARVRTGQYSPSLADPSSLLLPGLVLGGAIVGYALTYSLVGGFVGLALGAGAAYYLAVGAQSPH
jgi:hypothetical protein